MLVLRLHIAYIVSDEPAFSFIVVNECTFCRLEYQEVPASISELVLSFPCVHMSKEWSSAFFAGSPKSEHFKQIEVVNREIKLSKLPHTTD
jgi:hypothetical protein